ncbi:MAG: pentapeptide repeat-containing protein [Anaeromicrobium sp.]|jgi:hypothetical protein|uniref:pentapeptide repeat-containing protein n=1 Tax=Anaeromicrobium sp. TaxID=1929132 RepID=UPI0025EA19D3|nr:pentapeptide repeat-containing protein [Anaeromicrobium sp.]MCT4592685.1 pentapeptide repeat-containing protein [Anaeromicrobium sp.]
MSCIGKNRAIFSYKCANREKSNFMYKDFEKSESYRSNFSECNFNYATLRAAKFKFCNFDNATFSGTEFIGTNLRGSTFRNAIFEDTIFNSTQLDKTNFYGATFKNVYFLCSNINIAKNLNADSNNITILTKMPDIKDFTSELLDIVEKLRNNDIIRRSKVLHLKNKRINTLSLSMLKSDFTEEMLIKALPLLASKITLQFHTLSYLKKQLIRLVENGII